MGFGLGFCCCTCPPITIMVTVDPDADPLDEETEWKEVYPPRCIYLAESTDWNWGNYDDTEDPPVWHGLPLLLFATHPSSTWDDPDNIMYYGNHIFTSKVTVDRDSQYTGIDGDEWYPGNTYQMSFLVVYNTRTMKCKLVANCNSQGGNLFIGGIPTPSQNTNPSGSGGALSPHVLTDADTLSTPKTNIFRGEGGTISFSADEQATHINKNMIAGLAVTVPALDDPKYRRAEELTSLCFLDKTCAMIAGGARSLLTIHGFAETLLTMGSNWWFKSNDTYLEAVEASRITEVQGLYEYYNDGILTNTPPAGDPYFVGAYRNFDYEGDDTIEGDPGPISGYTNPSPIHKPFWFDPEATYLIEVDLLATFATFSDSASILTFNDASDPYGAMIDINGGSFVFRWELYLIFPTGSAGNIQSTHALQWGDLSISVPPSAGVVGHVLPGLHRVTATIEPDPDDCTQMKITKTGPAGTTVEYTGRPANCELFWLTAKGKPSETYDDDGPYTNPNPNDILHFGFSNLEITTINHYERPAYDLCKFTRFYYPAPWSNEGEIDGGYDFTFYRCNPIELNPVFKETDHPVDCEIVCGELPTGLTLNTNGTIEGTIAQGYSGDADGFVSIRMWDDQLAYVLTRNYYWVVKAVTSLSVDLDAPYHNTGPTPGGPTVDFVYRAGTISQLPNVTGDMPLTYSISSGAVPVGTKIVTTTGEIRQIGTTFAPDADATGDFTVRVTNACGDTADSPNYLWRVES